MMRKSYILSCAGAALLIATPAMAGFKLMPAGVAVAVAKSGLTVKPSIAWNKLGARPGRQAESWTLDGLSLNDVTFYGGIVDNTTLFREVDKTRKPLPRFSATMLAPDIAQLFEGSYRVAVGTSLMSIDAMEPATFAGQQGFRFTYSFTIQNEEVKRLGEARGAIVGGKLYLITYEAPKIHYFARDVAAFRALADSAIIAAVKKK
jgi:hypothetical protein